MAAHYFILPVPYLFDRHGSLIYLSFLALHESIAQVTCDEEREREPGKKRTCRSKEKSVGIQDTSHLTFEIDQMVHRRVELYNRSRTSRYDGKKFSTARHFALESVI